VKRWVIGLAVLGLLLGGVGSAKADILYNNLPASSSGADTVSSFGPLADSFSSGAGALNLSDVKLLLSGDPTSGGSITVSLLSDSSTSPGSVLTTIGTLADSFLSSTPAVFDFPTSFSLTANTRYWVELSSSNGSSALWSWSLDTSGVGVGSEFFANTTGVFTNTDGPYQMEVITGTSSVPEPATLALLGMGIAGIAGHSWRRRKLAAI